MQASVWCTLPFLDKRGTDGNMNREIDLPFLPVRGTKLEFTSDDGQVFEMKVKSVSWNAAANELSVWCKSFRFLDTRYGDKYAHRIDAFGPIIYHDEAFLEFLRSAGWDII